ncbi:MAG: urease accessory protein UreD [Moorea sp. SIO2B7]|nr:urease accessory protein UreD [Moorena sp. SIO2B7]
MNNNKQINYLTDKTIVELEKSGWHGIIDLVYANHNGATQVTNSYSKAPLKIQRPFYPEGKAICHSVVLHTAGGIVGGDRLSQNFHLQANAKTLITTAAANKIYRSNGKQAKQNINIKIDADACLEFMPQEAIVFNDAFYRQDLKVELAPGASFLGWEIIRFGRSSRGKKFLQGKWRSNTEVWQEGCPLWIDRQGLVGGEEMFYSPNALAGKPLVGTLYYIGKPVSQEIVEKARNCWYNREAQGEAGVTQLLTGLLCRYRGNSTSEVKTWFIDVWQLLRLNYLRISATKPRVWQLNE